MFKGKLKSVNGQVSGNIAQFDCFIFLVGWAFSLKTKLSDHTHV